MNEWNNVPTRGEQPDGVAECGLRVINGDSVAMISVVTVSPLPREQLATPFEGHRSQCTLYLPKFWLIRQKQK